MSSGYDFDLFSSRPAEKLLCGICLHVMRNPHQCSNGHLFCKGCITEWLKTSGKRECPFKCGAVLSEGAICRSTFVRDEIGELAVRCPCHEDDTQDAKVVAEDVVEGVAEARGCKWRGTLGGLESHTKVCEWQEVVCPNSGCGSILKSRDLSAHELSCGHLEVECQQCHSRMKRMEQDGHECPANVILCPHPECGCTHQRRDMDSHLSVCKWEEVACPYAEVGCSAQCPGRMRRQDVDLHVADPVTMMAHIAHLTAKVAEQKSTINTERSHGHTLDTLAKLEQCAGAGWRIDDPVDLLRNRLPEVRDRGDWVTHHIVWCGGGDDGFSMYDGFSMDTFSVHSPDTDLGNGVKGHIVIKRLVGPPFDIEDDDGIGFEDDDGDDDIGCFVHLEGYRGTADVKLTLFPRYRRSLASSTTVCDYFREGRCRFGDRCRFVHPQYRWSQQATRVWDNDGERGWSSFMSAEEFTSQRFVRDDQVCVLATIHLQR